MKKCIADSDCDVDKFDAYMAKEEDQEAGSVKRYFSAVDYVCTDDVKSSSSHGSVFILGIYRGREIFPQKSYIPRPPKKS